ncbi:MAG: hypothetical protein K8R74_04115, partial [Bacteroidales bacterium]|nr:hypothetical protein [Bacteroidales bacterium]
MLIRDLVNCRYYRLFIVIFLVLFINLGILAEQASLSKQSISGQLLLDTIWEPVVYLSYIPAFSDMYTMSHEMIIERSEIDNAGNFYFNTDYLPPQDNLYRIHISKKDDPPASLIIGGKEENHLFFIANCTSNVLINNMSEKKPFKMISITGYYPNHALRQVDEIENYIDSMNYNGSAVKKEFITKAIYGKLRFIADTSKHPLISLYALYKSKFESDFAVNQQFYRNYIRKWDNEKSTYFTSFRSQLPLSDNREILYRFLIGFIFLCVGFILSIFWKSRIRNNKRIESLSV